MRRISILTAGLLSTALLFSSALYSEEEAPREGDRIKPGSRPIAHTEWLKVQGERAQQDELHKNDLSSGEEQGEEEGEEAKASLLEKNGIKASSKFASPQTDIHYTSHAGAFHSPMSVSPLGDFVEFEDGSQWQVAPGDTYKTFNWLTSDLLVVTPNHSWFSNYMFCITNQNTGVSIKANLFLGPIYNGVFTHWIVSINYFTQEICLEDGSVWRLSGFDSSIFNKWLLNDTIIIGVNDGFLSSSKPNILINVNTLTYSRAKCFF